MTIGAISFQPYVYHVNAISPASMNRLSRISDDVLDKKTDYSGLTKAENENPLQPGQTMDFKGILEMQMQRGRSNASRIMKSAEETGQTEEAMPAKETGQAEEAMPVVDTKQTEETMPVKETKQTEEAMPAKEIQAADGGMGSGAAGDITNFRMQQAINAYEMFMTA